MLEFKVISVRGKSVMMQSPKGEVAYATKRVANMLLDNPQTPYEVQEITFTPHDRNGFPVGREETQKWFATFSRW